MRPLTLMIGMVFVVVGVLGFIPGVTTDYDTLAWYGHRSDAKLLGVFEVSILHNLVHLAFGVVGVVMARTLRSATAYLVIGGAVYLVLWLYGLVLGSDDDRISRANFVPLNQADDWLHLVLGVGMLALGALAVVTVSRSRPREAS